eukprot:scaffold38709_cov16-Tisochrysis_lutea.AAC.2
MQQGKASLRCKCQVKGARIKHEKPGQKSSFWCWKSRAYLWERSAHEQRSVPPVRARIPCGLNVNKLLMQARTLGLTSNSLCR